MMRFPKGVDVWLVWSRGLKEPTPSLGASSPGKPLFQTRSEKERCLAKHLLSDEDRDLPLAQLATRFPAPKMAET